MRKQSLRLDSSAMKKIGTIIIPYTNNNFLFNILMLSKALNMVLNVSIYISFWSGVDILMKRLELLLKDLSRLLYPNDLSWVQTPMLNGWNMAESSHTYTFITFVGILHGMSLMLNKVVSLTEGFFTFISEMEFFYSMNPPMVTKVRK